VNGEAGNGRVIYFGGENINMAKSKSQEASGMAFVGFIMLGLAFGLYTGQTAAGVLGGLGLAFLAYAVLRMKT
jgi:hypothetical protein